MSLTQKGFTLIELLVVIAVIGLMASIVFPSLNTARAKARDTARKESLRQLQKALELYYSDNNFYPAQGSWASSEPSDAVTYSANYIPNLVSSGFVVSLPRDPLGGSSSICGGSWKRAFLYSSNGVDYKLLSHCAPETGFSSSDVFYDPTRPTWAWQISTPGASAW